MKTKHNTLGQGIRNQSYFLHKKSIGEQDSKILTLLSIEKVASAWTLAGLSGIFITSTRRSLTNLNQARQIKEVGSEISKVSGVRNTLYALINTSEEEVREWKRQKAEQDEKDAIDDAELTAVVEKTKKMIAEDYLNKMIKAESNNN